MKQTKIVFQLICDRCGEESTELYELFGPPISVSVCSHAENWDLCNDCRLEFFEFMKKGGTKIAQRIEVG